MIGKIRLLEILLLKIFMRAQITLQNTLFKTSRGAAKELKKIVQGSHIWT